MESPSLSTLEPTVDESRTDIQVRVGNEDATDSHDDDEEWTKSRKVVNQRTKQVETRVQRQVVMEGDKVIADSGPLVTTCTREDNKTEQTENKSGRNKGQPTRIVVLSPDSEQAVVAEKTETFQKMREAKRECLQYHDESVQELTGSEVHKKAVSAPNELIRLEEGISDGQQGKGKLCHYSNKCLKVSEKEEVKEVSRLGRDGNLVTQVTRTHHHEEVDDEELPEEKGNSGAPLKIQYHKEVPRGQATSEYARNGRLAVGYKPIVSHGLNAQERNRSTNVSNESVNTWIENHFGSDPSLTSGQSSAKGGLPSNGAQLNARKDATSSMTQPMTRKDQKTSSVVYINGASREGFETTSLQRDNRKAQGDNFRRKYYAENGHPLGAQSELVYSTLPKDTKFTRKEDASVQASLSEDEEEEEGEYTRNRHLYHRTDAIVHDVDVRTMSGETDDDCNSLGSFYFGDQSDRSYHLRVQREKREQEKAFEEYRRALENGRQKKPQQEQPRGEQLRSPASIYLSEESCLPPGVRNGGHSEPVKTSINKLLNARRESFSHPAPREEETGRRSEEACFFSPSSEGPLLDIYSDPDRSVGNSSFQREKQLYCPPSAGDGSVRGRRVAEYRQRSLFSVTSTPPPPPPSPPISSSSPMPELIKPSSSFSARYDNLVLPNKESSNWSHSAPSPSGGSGTWTKSKGRKLAPLFRTSSPDNLTQWPEYSELLSPTEILNIPFSDSADSLYFPPLDTKRRVPLEISSIWDRKY